ncbi:acyl carrier protein [Variovorax sp. J22P168]|uniref:acyl carrier protein n=1 Tax=Variovorax jilinensis TaxID=3053513 RepID=UPI0025749354|nr:acyl carrier protein [Variovorax sp. J22P168]MDM0011241.1 acyl carrier protein [Variovorax sp. J22P168]
MSTICAPAAVSPPSSTALLARLRSLFSEASGMDLSGADDATSFMGLGLDSLTLTLAAAEVKRAFGVVPTFRQLMETQRDFASLARYLQEMTAVAAAAKPAATATAAAADRPGLDANRPPQPGARLGRDPSGKPAWYIPDRQQPGRYVPLA